MACFKSFTLEPAQEEDVPLDQAIYSASQNAIFAVRGQWVYKFNATTGEKQSEFRYIDGVLAESSIVELNGFLYVGFWRNVIWPYSNLGVPPPGAIEYNPQDIYKIDFGLTTATPLGLDIAFGDYGGPSLEVGFSNLVTDGATYIYGMDRYGGGLFRLDPTNIAGYDTSSNTLGNPETVLFDLSIDLVNGVMWASNHDDGELNVADLNVFSTFDQSNSSGAQIPGIVGVSFSPSNTKLYGVKGDRTIVKGNANLALPKNFLNNFSYSLLNDILSLGSAPVKIKYNPHDGLIYVPTWAGDTVEVLDPATDTITAVKTGFLSPYDCVFTPTKKWAVQNSSVGLQEIT